MISKGILLNAEELKEAEYLLRRLGENATDVAEGKDYRWIGVADDGLRAELVTEIITGFYKFRALEQAVRVRYEGYHHAAFLAALLSFDGEDERRSVRRAAKRFDCVSPRSLCAFCLPEFEGVWQEIAALGNRLTSRCAGLAEHYEIISFLLGISGNRAPKVRLSTPNSKTIVVGSHPYPVADLTDDTGKNLLIAALTKRPSGIVLSDPSRFDPALIDVIERLGES